MSSLLLRWSLRHHRRQAWRSGLAVLGIALGVALLVAVQATLGSAAQAFERATEAAIGRATHALHGGPSGVPVEALAALSRERGVVAAPVVEGQLYVGGRVFRYLGVDPFVEPDMRPQLARVGQRSEAAGSLFEAGAFVATRATMRRLGVEVGGRVDADIAGRAFGAKCIGAVADDSASGLDDVLLVDIATAQEWKATPRHVDRVDLVLAAGVDADALCARIGAGLRAEPAAMRESFRELTAAFRSNLEALGLLSLVVGAFLVHAAMRAAVASRQVEFALLRALGADARRVALCVAREAALLGVLGAVLGCALGQVGAAALVDPLVATLNDLFTTVALHGVENDPLLWLAALFLGPLVAVLAASGPVREAVLAPPRAVFVSGRLPVPQADVPLRWLVPLCAIASALLAFAGRSMAMAHAGLLCACVAIAIAAPRAVESLLAFASRLPSRSSPWLAYVLRSAARSRQRVGAAVAALVLAIGITTGLGAMIQSFRSTVSTWLEDAIPADVYVASPGSVDARENARLSDEALAALRGAAGNRAVSTYRPMRVHARSGATPFEETRATAMAPSERVSRRLPLLDEVDRARERFSRGEGVLATEPLAARWGLRAGDRIDVATDEGTRSTTVLAIERHYRTPRGELVLPSAWFPRMAPESLGIEADAGEDADALAERLRQALASVAQAAVVSTRESIERTTMKVFDRTFAITDALRVVCLLVAALGIWSSFSALQLDRQKEIAVLRALGASPKNVRGLVLGQTALLGLAAGLLSLPVGAFLGYVLATVVNRGSFGWTLLAFELPAPLLIEALALALGASVAAGLWPAIRMARQAPAAALRED